MPEKLTPLSPEGNSKRKEKKEFLEKIKAVMGQQPEDESNISEQKIKEDRKFNEWKEGASLEELRAKLDSLQLELIELYQKREVKNGSSSQEEMDLRDKIKILDEIVNPQFRG